LRSLHEEIRELHRDVLELKKLLSRRLELDQRGANNEKIDPRDVATDVPNGMLAFTATWCGPCMQMQPIIQNLQKAGFAIRSVDVDKDPKLASALGIEIIPQFVVVVDGKVQKRITGSTTKATLIELLTRFNLVNSADEETAFQKHSGEKL